MLQVKKGKRMDLLGVIFPVKCPVCDEIVGFNKGLICRGCKNKLEYIKEPRCKKCGKKVYGDMEEYCMDCIKTVHYFDMGVSLINHKGVGSQSVYRIKYFNKREYVRFYARELVRNNIKLIWSWKIDLIIPVPLSFEKKLKRGFNQAGLLADEISKILNIQMDEYLLERSKNTRPLKEMGRKERKKALEKAFKINKFIKKFRYKNKLPKRVLIVDDIYTTGNTIDACAKVLKEHGVKKVFFMTISNGKA